MLNGYIAHQILWAFINGENKRDPIRFIQIIFKPILRIVQPVFSIVQPVFSNIYQAIQLTLVIIRSGVFQPSLGIIQILHGLRMICPSLKQLGS